MNRSNNSHTFFTRRVILFGVGMIASLQVNVAQDATPGQPTLRYDELLALFIKKYDTNGDGRLDNREFAVAVQTVMQKALLRKYDQNHDGKLDARELAAMQQYQELIQRAVLMKYDVNREGFLNEQQKAAANRDLLKQIQLVLPKPDRSGSKQTP